MREGTKHSIKTGVAVLTITGLTMGGVALAQTTEDVEPVAPDITEESTETPCRSGRHRGGHMLGAVAELTGLDVPEIIEQLEAGSTIAEVAAANGSSGDAVVAALVEALSERLAEGVADERLTQEEADEKLAEATLRFQEAVNGEYQGPREFGRGFRGGNRGAQVEAIAEVLGLTVDDLSAAKADGQSLGDLAEQQGVAIDDLVDVMVAPLQERLNDAVADERLTQAEADERLADATQRITERIESGESFGPRGPGGRRGPGRGGFGAGNGPGNGSGFGPGNGASAEEVVNA